ncbi:MAG: heme o synthase [Chloroflexi bacterium]|nr:heme o synthase [Chloroflexota bacterium]
MIASTNSSGTIIRDYIALTKPRIISLLLVTALGGMYLAAGGNPPVGMIFLVLGAGSLAAGGAHALNHFLDKDIDSMMTRTSKRPVAGGRVSPRDALIFGIVLNVIAFFLLFYLANPLSAAITMAATLVYVFVYTVGLKRRTPQNIVIGGAAGAFPPMIGWAAITGSVDLPAIYLFAIVFFWTPPHFWALALLLKEDYKEASIPMLPVVTTVEETKYHILLYTVLLLVLTLMFFVTGAVGWVYLIGASVLGTVFVYEAWKLRQSEGLKGTKRAYLYSLLYLTLLFVVIVADSLVKD